ncbi:MAG: dUTP diphosphatase, partial [Clostridia bacterium]|nr:dUTP diphosphatase [Clostridia bacterium]
MEVQIKKIRENAILPRYGTPYSAGADLYAVLDGAVTLAPSETRLIPTGLAIAIPEGYAGLIYARSGLA